MRTRLLIICALCCISAVSHAQSTCLGDNPKWSYLMGWWHTDMPGLYTCDSQNKFYTGETVEKGGKTYYKLYVDVAHLDYSGSVKRIGLSDGDMFSEYLFGMREDAGRIYVDEQEYMDFLRNTDLGDPDYVPYERTADGELVLYDFTMEVGDRFRSVEGYPDVWVAEVKDTCTDDGVSRKVLTLSNGLVIVEGIGCVYSTGMLPAYLNPKGDVTYYYGPFFAGLSSFYFGDTRVYSMDVEQMNRYGVAVGMTTVTEPERAGGVGVYSIDGRRLPGVPQRGIYIRDGKKILAK